MSDWIRSVKAGSKRTLSEEERFLAERYGKRYISRSPWKVPAAIVALIGLPWLLWSAGFHSSPPIRHELIAFKVIDDRSIEITYLIERNVTKLPIVCTLVARDFEKNIVGEVTDEFAANTNVGSLVQTRSIPTRTQAVNAAVIGCDPL